MFLCWCFIFFVFFSSIRSFDFICLCPFTTPNFPLVCKKTKRNTTIYLHQCSRFATRVPAFSIGFSTLLFLHPTSKVTSPSAEPLRPSGSCSVQLGSDSPSNGGAVGPLVFSNIFGCFPPTKTPLIGGDWNMAGLWLSIYGECHHPNWRTPSFFRGVGGSTINQSTSDSLHINHIINMMIQIIMGHSNDWWLVESLLWPIIMRLIDYYDWWLITYYILSIWWLIIQISWNHQPTRDVFFFPWRQVMSSSIQLTISAGAISEKCQGGDVCHGMGPGDALVLFMGFSQPVVLLNLMRISMEIWNIYLLEISIGDIQLLIISNNNM